MQIFQPLQSVAYAYLKEKIENGQLERDVLYSETKLCQEIGVSRTPFRDAIQRLAQEGYLDIVPSKGFRLHRMSEEDLVDTLQIRRALEGYCVRMLAEQQATEYGRRILAALNAQMDVQRRLAAENGSAAAFTASDTSFHKTIVSVANSKVITDIYNAYMHRIDTQIRLSFDLEKNRMRETVQEHQNVLDAIPAGMEKSCVTLDFHLQQVAAILKTAVE